MDIKTRFSTQSEYIEYVAPAVQRACKKMYVEQNFFVYPEIIIAMMCHENGYGQDKTCFVLNDVQNFLGMKSELLNNSNWYTLWDGRSINKLTPEVYNHQEVKIYDDFRVYKDPEQCALDFLCFLRWAAISGKCPTAEPKYYPVLHTIHDPYEQIRYIHKRGYSTGLYYADRIIEKCKKWNLQIYDDLSRVEASKYWPTNAPVKGSEKMEKIKINKHLGQLNHTAKKRSKKDIQFIVMHYVGNTPSDAYDNAKYYASTKVKASADFYVGYTGDIWQGNDYWNYYSWHCGGEYQSSWTKNGGGRLYGVCTNANSVGIELCVRKVSTKTKLATDTDWYFENATVKSAVKLVAHLMRELDVDINHVIMHYHVNRKICPNPWVIDNNKWINFINMVKKEVGDPDIIIEQDTDIKWFRVRKSWKDTKSQLGAYQSLDNAKANCPPGYSVYDVDGKEVFNNKNEEKSSAGYRARVGIYKYQKYIDKLKKAIKDKLDLECFEEKKSDGIHVYCGSYSTKKGAEDRVNFLRKNGFDAEIESR